MMIALEGSGQERDRRPVGKLLDLWGEKLRNHIDSSKFELQGT